MRLIIASDSFKETLSSRRAAELGEAAAKAVFLDCCCQKLEIADGGEGTLDAVLASTGGKKVSATVRGPLGEALDAPFGLLGGGRAFVEMASAAGLGLVPPEKRDPLFTTTFGVGQLVLAALDGGCRDITVAIGGSATNDGGLGFSRALGMRFLDEEGRELPGRGCDLTRLASIDAGGLDPRLAACRFTVMCDVDNPLCGPDGATYTFGPQKGADEAGLRKLEEGMCRLREVIRRDFAKDADRIPGAGAAGGLGAALSVFFGAELKSGIETLLDLIGFDEKLRETDLVITGEGRADAQSSHGKAISGIARRCQKAGVPCIALVGRAEPDSKELLDLGLSEIIETTPRGLSFEEIRRDAERYYYEAARALFVRIKAEGKR